jgi:hypothetical protein
MLDDVERRRFLVQPAREDSVELALGIAHVDLDEGSGQLLRLPRRRRLAGAESNDHVPDPHRLARLQGQVAGDSVALVEQAEHRHALRHRRGAGGFDGDVLRDVDRARLARRLAVARRSAAALAAPGERREPRGRDQHRPRRPAHPRSGLHAS